MHACCSCRRECPRRGRQRRGPKRFATASRSREKGHIDAISLAIGGFAAEALALVRSHAAAYPRDALPLSLALGVFGLIGFSGRLDHHEAQLALLEELAPSWGEDWWFLGYLGWAYIETGAVEVGTRLVERSLAGNPRNAHAAHQRVHGFFESGDAAAGAAFLDAWLPDYDRVGQLHCHLSWHLALFELARGNSDRARAIYLDSIRPSVAQSAPMLSLADFRVVPVALVALWRNPSALAGMGRGCRACAPTLPSASLAFADLHAGFAETAIGDADAAERRIAGLHSLAEQGRLPPGKAAPGLCAGAVALARGDNARAATVLEAALPDLPRIGGSHAQREIFEDFSDRRVSALRTINGGRAFVAGRLIAGHRLEMRLGSATARHTERRVRVAASASLRVCRLTVKELADCPNSASENGMSAGTRASA